MIYGIPSFSGRFVGPGSWHIHRSSSRKEQQVLYSFSEADREWYFEMKKEILKLLLGKLDRKIISGSENDGSYPAK